MEAIDVEEPEVDDERFWSVTTLLRCLDKPALLQWAAKQTATAAVDELDDLPSRLERDGYDETVKWLSYARDRAPEQMLTPAERGTAVHAAIDEYVKLGKFPRMIEQVRPYVEQFAAWADVWQPEWLYSEETVFDREYRYAGTCDAWMVINGRALIVDYKTSDKKRRPYPEVALQLAAYRYAELVATWRARRTSYGGKRYYLVKPDEIEMATPPPVVEGGLCIQITPVSCVAYPVRCDEAVFRHFLHVTEAARWSFLESRTVIGKELTPKKDMEEQMADFPVPKTGLSATADLPPTRVDEQ